MHGENMKTLSDIMISSVCSVNDTDNVHQARMLFKDKGIRHLPVLYSDSGKFAGVLTQRSLLNHAFNIVEKFGMGGLEKREKRTLVDEIMIKNCVTADPGMDLVSVAELFMAKKHSCLPIVEDGQLKVIVTPVDFVKLAVQLLKE
jgi:CBS domain-containing protein